MKGLKRLWRWLMEPAPSGHDWLGLDGEPEAEDGDTCPRCKGSGIDPEYSLPAEGPSYYSMGEPPALEPCIACRHTCDTELLEQETRRSESLREELDDATEEITLLTNEKREAEEELKENADALRALRRQRDEAEAVIERVKRALAPRWDLQPKAQAVVWEALEGPQEGS